MPDSFESFLIAPTSARYLAARRALFGDPEFQATSDAIVTLERLYVDERFQELQSLIERRLPDLKLSARVHYLAAQVAQWAGDQAEFESEQFAMQACLQGLSATGDGSRRRPFQVTYACDPTDILDARRADAQSQTLVRDGARWLDVVTCRDGAQLWFDVTELRKSEALHRRPATVKT